MVDPKIHLRTAETGKAFLGPATMNHGQPYKTEAEKDKEAHEKLLKQ